MWERMREKRNEGGFTLIELLIVIVILAILAAIVVFAVGTTGSNAKAAACSADAKSFETALESYKAEVGLYPGEGLGSNPPTGQATPNYYGLAGQPVGGGNAATPPNWYIGNNPNNQQIGPFLRSLPTVTHYQVVTDGNGGVFILPNSANYKTGITTIAGALAANGGSPRVEDVSSLPGAATDANPINFDTNTSICGDTALVS